MNKNASYDLRMAANILRIIVEALRTGNPIGELEKAANTLDRVAREREQVRSVSG